MTTLSASLRDGLSRHATRPSVEWTAGESWTYQALSRRADGFARALAGRGAGSGERVLVQVEKSPHALALYLAVQQIGAVYVPLNPDYTAQELAYFFADAAPRVAICDPKVESIFQSIAAEHRGTAIAHLAADGAGTLRGDAGAAPDPAIGAQDLAAILYTSGTTGRPKGAMLSQDNLLSNARTLIDLWRFTSADCLIHALPLFHTHGLFVACHCALLSGASMIMLPRFDADMILARMKRATVLMGVPTFYTRLLAQEGLSREAVRNMRLFISGSAPLSPETHRVFEARTGQRILERYGMTETGMLTSNPYEGARIPGSVGPPLPGVMLRISDPASGQALPKGDVGSVEVKGANVLSGYWRAAEKTAEAFRPDGFFITGDLGYRDGEGYVHLVGRAKDLIISGGLNIYPAEVEDALHALPGIAEAAAIGVPHADLGEAVIAIIRPEPGAALSEGALREALGRQLARYKIPKRIYLVGELPRNAMGKVQKTALRASYAGAFSAEK